MKCRCTRHRTCLTRFTCTVNEYEHEHDHIWSRGICTFTSTGTWTWNEHICKGCKLDVHLHKYSYSCSISMLIFKFTICSYILYICELVHADVYQSVYFFKSAWNSLFLTPVRPGSRGKNSLVRMGIFYFYTLKPLCWKKRFTLQEIILANISVHLFSHPKMLETCTL